jgi:RNase P subunit RPR2
VADVLVLNPGEQRVRTARIGGVDHAIVLGRRIMFGRLVSCECGWVDRFRYGRRRQDRAARRHLESYRQLFGADRG